MARPTKYTEEVIEEYANKLNEYIENTDIPIVVEFCYLNDIRKERVYEFARSNEEFSHSLKKCIEKKEAQLEKLALKGAINSTMAIFSLKQLGWRDRQDEEQGQNAELLNAVVSAIRGVKQDE